MGDVPVLCEVASSACADVLEAMSTLRRENSFRTTHWPRGRPAHTATIRADDARAMYEHAVRLLGATACLLAAACDDAGIEPDAQVTLDANRRSTPNGTHLSSAAGERAPQGVRPTPAVSSSPQDAADARAFARHATHRPDSAATRARAPSLSGGG